MNKRERKKYNKEYYSTNRGRFKVGEWNEQKYLEALNNNHKFGYNNIDLKNNADILQTNLSS